MSRGSVDVHHKSQAHYVSRVNLIRLHSFSHVLGFIPCIPTGLSQNACFQTSLVPDLGWCLRWRGKLNYLVNAAQVKPTTNVASRREENMRMRSKLPMFGGSSVTFKSSLLVLFGPYTERLLCKFEKK